jgi:LysR family transcriptional regulator, hydrogen peroxide-inducible genes activator
MLVEDIDVQLVRPPVRITARAGEGVSTDWALGFVQGVLLVSGERCFDCRNEFIFHPTMFRPRAARGKIYVSYELHRICISHSEGVMEVHQLRYFCAVAHHGTFTRASEVEHVAQPSLSQQVAKLEAELGARLFDRLPRSAKLTVFGKAFLPKAEQILRELEAAKTELQEMSGNDRGDVSVGIIPTIAAYLLPRLLDGFSLRHPQITVKIFEDITSVLLQRLHAGTLDIAIVALPIAGNELESEGLFEEKMYAVLPEKHRRASRPSISLAELNREPFLLLKEGHCFRDSVIAACRQSKMSPSVVFESGQFATILAMVSAGMGVSAVPAMAVQPHPGCKFVAISGKHSTRKVGIVTSRHHFQSRAQRLLMNQMRGTCGARRNSRTVSPFAYGAH